VLDVGCGTGRLTLDFLQEGIDIDGVDNSPEMLALCRQKAEPLGLAPCLYQGAMERLELPRRYRTILVPSSTLQLITNPEEATAAMQRFFAHLMPGGVLAASIMQLWKPDDPLESAWEKTATRDADGVVFRRVARSRYDPATELEHTEDWYQVLQGGKVIAQELHRRSPATRSYNQVQAQELFARGGFTKIRLYKEFTLEPAGPEDMLVTVVGERA
jgi:ubiquinone/menaquinone biosynthesis C-methylase UbiE